MRVLVVVHGFPPAAQGGTEIYAHAHAVALRDAGDDVLVFTREQDPARPDYDSRVEHRDGLRIVWVNNLFRNTRTFADTYRNDAIDAIAGRAIDDFRPHVAHIHHLTCLSTTIVRLLAERDIPLVMTLHDYWLLCHRGQLLDTDYQVCDGPRNDGAGCGRCLGPAGEAGTVGFAGAAALRTLERNLPHGAADQLRRTASQVAAVAFRGGASEDQERARIAHMRSVCADVTHFLAPSEHMRDRFVQFGVSPDHITIARNGCDHRPFRSVVRTTRAGASPLRIGFLGSLMVSKAPHLILEAAGRLPPGTVSIDFFGAPSAYHGDDRYCRQFDVLARRSDGVRVHGAIARERVAGALASLDVLVVPSVWPENSPLVIQEAFLAGVPVVASRIGGIPEMVEHGRNGLLFRAGDADDLSQTLLRLLDEPRLLDTLRAGIPPVRSIEEDVSVARGLYQQLFSPCSPELKLGPTTRTKSPSPLEKTPHPRLAAVVLNYRTPDGTLLAVKSLLASQSAIEPIIVVDNDQAHDPDRGTGESLQQALSTVWSRITFIRTGRNLGFSGGMNVGIREALARGAERVLLVNSDVHVPPDAIGRLERTLETNRQAGIVGPVVVARSDLSTIASLGMSYAATTGRMRHSGVGDRVPQGIAPADRVVDGVSGCLMLVRREVFDAVGMLDEDYFFSFEDLDFCLRARRAGFTTVLASRAAVYHQGGQSIGAGSPRRLYFAARNHLLLARRADQSAGVLASTLRASSILALNLAHAIRCGGGGVMTRLSAVVRGWRDYTRGRFGSD